MIYQNVVFYNIKFSKYRIILINCLNMNISIS